MNRAAFLDRDGVINRKASTEGQYVTCWEQMEILPGVAQAIALLNRAGFLVIVVSNQRCIAKRLVSAEELEFIHARMCEVLAGAGALIDRVYYCPHEEYPPCVCRKPAPGMLLNAARAHDIDLGASWMIGDSDKDVQTGKTAGCRTARLVQNGEGGNGADLVTNSLLDATYQILKWRDLIPAAEGCHGVATPLL